MLPLGHSDIDVWQTSVRSCTRLVEVLGGPWWIPSLPPCYSATLTFTSLQQRSRVTLYLLYQSKKVEPPPQPPSGSASFTKQKLSGLVWSGPGFPVLSVLRQPQWMVHVSELQQDILRLVVCLRRPALHPHLNEEDNLSRVMNGDLDVLWCEHVSASHYAPVRTDQGLRKPLPHLLFPSFFFSFISGP